MESGFKFKSISSSLDTAEIGSEAVRSLFDRVAAALPPYVPPKIDPFMTAEQFQALPKTWVYRYLGKGDGSEDRAFTFLRLFTSGVSNGRPDNPFLQGFVFSNAKDVLRYVYVELPEKWGFRNLRPADLRGWAGWLDPRGDAELESAEIAPIDSHGLVRSYENWLESVEDLFELAPAEALYNLSGYANAVATKTDFYLCASNESSFLEWVSILTHLIPSRSGWQVQFTSGHSCEVLATNLVGVRLARADQPSTSESMSSPWANLAIFCVRNGLLQLVDSKIADLSLLELVNHDLNAMARLGYDETRLATLPQIPITARLHPLGMLPFACRELRLVPGKDLAIDVAVEFEELICATELQIAKIIEGAK